jgi:hypothetical protein
MESLPRVTKEHVRIASAIMTIIGALYTWQASRLPMGDPVGSGEGGTPLIVGILWVVFGLFVTVRTPALHEHDEEVGTWPDSAAIKRLVIAVLLCIGFVVFLNVLGTLATSAIFMAFMARLCGASWARSATVSIIMAVCLWLLFVKLLQLSLPQGVILAMLPGA